jgi:hypothetical protein
MHVERFPKEKETENYAQKFSKPEISASSAYVETPMRPVSFIYNIRPSK